MKHSLRTRSSLASVLAGVVIVFATTAQADWNIGDPFKMHYPQLPDPNGWDVNFMQPKVLADDWLCTETGPVSDVHLWFSSRQDQPFQITSVHLSIHADIPRTPTNYSRPGAELWKVDLTPNYFNWRIWGTGDQGFYDPNLGTAGVFPNDHHITYQLNIPRIPDPFIQQRDTIYWLDVSMQAIGAAGNVVQLGWKTSGSPHFLDDAVWSDFLPAGGVLPWSELRDPFTQQSLDLAFVITVPEPGAWMLGGIGGAFWFLTLRRRNRDR